MNILITYESNSGSTHHTAKLIEEKLVEANNKVTLKKAGSTSVDDIEENDFVLVGSPSWLVDNVQGRPHEEVSGLLSRIEQTYIENKKVAVFGCGDDSYINFCGAVDVIEKDLLAKNARQVVPSLRVNSFYFNIDKNIQMIQAWAQVLSEQISK